MLVELRLIEQPTYTVREVNKPADPALLVVVDVDGRTLRRWRSIDAEHATVQSEIERYWRAALQRPDAKLPAYPPSKRPGRKRVPRAPQVR